MKLDGFELAKLKRRLDAEIAADSIVELDEGPRSHLGASVMGDACERKLWLGFRWAKKEAHSARMLRLFRRGHYEEPKFINRLKRVGFEIYEHDPATGKQFRIVGANGHYGGSGDGLGYAPPHYGLEGAGVFEFKTHGETSYAKLAGKITSKTPEIVREKGEGLKKSKPMHFAQMSQYGACYGLKWGLYCAINKNTDELYFEFVELDYTLANSMFLKAERIVNTQVPPPKISETKSFFDCKYCHLSGICFDGHAPEKNCRSCVNGVPAPEGQWGCAFHNELIPPEVIPQGCPHWTRII